MNPSVRFPVATRGRFIGGFYAVLGLAILVQALLTVHAPWDAATGLGLAAALLFAVGGLAFALWRVDLVLEPAEQRFFIENRFGALKFRKGGDVRELRDVRIVTVNSNVEDGELAPAGCPLSVEVQLRWRDDAKPAAVVYRTSGPVEKRQDLVCAAVNRGEQIADELGLVLIGPSVQAYPL